MYLSIKKEILSLKKELDQIAEEDLKNTEKKMAQNPNYEEVVDLRRKAEACWEKKNIKMP